VQGHIQKLGLKINKRKLELKKWTNGVGERIEEKLMINHEKSTGVIEVMKHVTDIDKYSV